MSGRLVSTARCITSRRSIVLLLDAELAARHAVHVEQLIDDARELALWRSMVWRMRLDHRILRSCAAP